MVVRPIRWSKLRADEAERVVNVRAADSSKVLFSQHAFDRISQRSITIMDALSILREGHVDGEPALQKNGTDWKVVMTRRMSGGREAGVVTIIFSPPKDQLFVVTVEWMDGR